MKNIISILLISVLIILLSACGDVPEKEDSKSSYPTPPKSIDIRASSDILFDFYASPNGYIYKTENNKSNLFYIRGVNMGLTEPTTDLNNPNVSYDTYYKWFGQIKDMNANTVRAFTVMNPNFYKAFYDYNKNNAYSPLYLIQGIWFSEELMYQLTDALESDRILINAFKRSVRETIDIIHGNSDYTVYGQFSPAVYDNDISKFVVGYILGLEYPAEFVIETNASHPKEAIFKGQYLQTSDNASPFEAFLCEVGETLIDFETKNYKHQTPVAFLNWQTLDTLTHSNEPFYEEDAVSVNTENILSKPTYFSNLFAAVDIYPYYPEFMNYQSEYMNYRDESGNRNSYEAYLKDLKTQYSVPVLVAEYGLSTSRGVAHTSIIGYNQGGLTEEEQGNYVAKMTKSIALEGYCGGLIFSWQDEWFKRTWNTDMFYPDNPADRTHNLSSAEQGYGFLGFDVSSAYPDGNFDDWDGVNYLADTKIKVQFDADYMHLLIDLPKDFNFESDSFYVPISVLGVGSKKSIDFGISFDTNCDFLLKINGKNNTRILCDANYDVFRYKYSALNKVFNYEKSENNNGKYNEINTFISNEMYLPDDDKTIPPKFYESGLLKFGVANPKNKNYSSQADFYYKNGKVEVRIAWYLINVANSRLGVCIDSLDCEVIAFTNFDNIFIGGGMSGKIKLVATDFQPLREIKITPRLKRSYNIMAKSFLEVMSDY